MAGREVTYTRRPRRQPRSPASALLRKTLVRMAPQGLQLGSKFDSGKNFGRPTRPLPHSVNSAGARVSGINLARSENTLLIVLWDGTWVTAGVVGIAEVLGLTAGDLAELVSSLHREAARSISPGRHGSIEPPSKKLEDPAALVFELPLKEVKLPFYETGFMGAIGAGVMRFVAESSTYLTYYMYGSKGTPPAIGDARSIKSTARLPTVQERRRMAAKELVGQRAVIFEESDGTFIGEFLSHTEYASLKVDLDVKKRLDV